jgi:RNA polymerase sigma-70 factor (sigma-E family)
LTSTRADATSGHCENAVWRSIELGQGWKQQDAASRVSSCMEPDEPGDAGAVCLPGPVRLRCDAGDGAEAAVSALYQASALRLIGLAYMMLGDRPSAEDVVQEAFCGLYRRWDRLADADSALYYVRASVLNGCRSVLRRRAARHRAEAYDLPAASAETVVLSGEEREEVIRALGRLPRRQREALVLRFYLDLSDEQIARVMGIGPSTVRSTAYRGIEALGRALKERS